MLKNEKSKLRIPFEMVSIITPLYWIDETCSDKRTVVRTGSAESIHRASNEDTMLIKVEDLEPSEVLESLHSNEAPQRFLTFEVSKASSYDEKDGYLGFRAISTSMEELVENYKQRCEELAAFYSGKCVDLNHLNDIRSGKNIDLIVNTDTFFTE